MRNGARFQEIFGPSTLKDAYNAVTDKDRAEAWILHELNLEQRNIPAGTYPELPRQEGDGCCCNFIVEDAVQKQVYFFSRFVGASNYCNVPMNSTQNEK